MYHLARNKEMKFRKSEAG